MRRTVYVSALALLIFACGTALAQDQDLAAAARKARAAKKNAPATKVWTNEDIGRTPAPAPPPAANDANAGAAQQSPAKPADAPKEAPANDKAKAASAMQSRIDAQKAEIATLTREIDLAEGELKLQVATYYADAGNSLRDPKKFADERDSKQKTITDKKAALAAAKAKLDDLVEQARKDDIKVNQ